KEPSLSHIGPITRNVHDAVAMLNVIGRYDYRDPYATRGQPKDWGADMNSDLRGLRIGYSPDLGYADVDPSVARHVRRAADRLSRLGAEIVEIDPGFESPMMTFQRLWFTASQALWSQCDERQRDLLDPGLVSNARRAEPWKAVDLF